MAFFREPGTPLRRSSAQAIRFRPLNSSSHSLVASGSARSAFERTVHISSEGGKSPSIGDSVNLGALASRTSSKRSKWPDNAAICLLPFAICPGYQTVLAIFTPKNQSDLEANSETPRDLSKISPAQTPKNDCPASWTCCHRGRNIFSPGPPSAPCRNYPRSVRTVPRSLCCLQTPGHPAARRCRPEGRSVF